MNTVALLKAWGRWQRNELNHLGYKQVRFVQGTYISEWANEDDLMFVDDILCQLKKQNPMYFSVLKWRFVYLENYREITIRLHKKSPKVASNMLCAALALFDQLLKGVESSCKECF